MGKERLRKVNSIRKMMENSFDFSKAISVQKLGARIDKSEEDFRNGRYKTSEELLN